MKVYSFTKKLKITNYKLILAIITALALSIFFGMTARAQDGFPTDDDVNKIAKQLYCPVCESTPLDVCPTEGATNVGYPGYATAATDEVFNTFVIPTMFARVARDEMTAQAAAEAAQKDVERIFAKWK